MKKKKILTVFLAVLLLCCLQVFSAEAADGASIFMKASKTIGSDIVTVSCEIDGAGEITNGKLRIHYEADKLEFQKWETGQGLTENFMTEVNDPVQGNRQPGEVIFVFASSKAQRVQGSLVNLTFRQKDGAVIQASDFAVAVEELENGAASVQVESGENTYTEVAPDKPTEPDKPIDPGVKKISISKVRIDKIKDQTYTKKTIRPMIKAVYGGKTLIEGVDYFLSYAANKKVGKAVITVTGMGAYEGKTKVSFCIVPKAPKLKSVKSPAKKKVLVRWKKVSQADGYEIKIAANSKFTKSVRTVTVKKAKTVKKKAVVKGRGRRRYYVRIRAYKRIDGVKHYSKFSAKKSIRVK